MHTILPDFDAVIKAHKEAILDIGQSVKVPPETLTGVDLSEHFAITSTHYLHYLTILPEEHATVVGKLQASPIPPTTSISRDGTRGT